MLFQAVDVGDAATVGSILSHGDVDVSMVVSGGVALLLTAVQTYDITALPLLRAGAGRSHVAPWGTAPDVARMLEDEGGGYIETHHAQWLLEVILAGEATPSAP